MKGSLTTLHNKIALPVIIAALCWPLLFPGAVLAGGKDFDGDGNDEIATLYDYPQNCAAIWLAKPAGSGFSQTAIWASTYRGWNASESRVLSGNFDANSAYDDIAILQSYPNACAALWVFSSTGTGLSPSPVWASALRGFDVSKTKTASGDFDGDGRTEILALTEFPNANAALILFDNPGTGWTVRPVWASPNGTFPVTTPQVSAGDFDNDGRDELAVLKAYPQSCAAVWVFDAAAPTYTATAWWASSYGAWDTGKSRMVAGNFDANNGDELAVLYDYPNNSAALWMFTPSGLSFTASPKWASSLRGWDASLGKLTAGDTDGNGADELYIMQEYPNSCAALWQYPYNGTSFSGTPVWASARGAWNVKKTHLAEGNTFNPLKSYLGNTYIIGYSVLGRPITATKIGNGNRRYLFVGAYHGNEMQNGRVLQRFTEHLLAHPEAVPRDAEVWIVPYLNPDGVAAGTRWNASGVNLNRNFGTADWGLYGVSALEAIGFAPLSDMSAVITGVPYSFNYPGPEAFSEPETSTIRSLCSGASFRAMISMHESEGCVYWGQNDAGLAYLFGARAGLPVVVDPDRMSGTASQWFREETGGSAITVELTGAETGADPAFVFGAYLPAFLATLNY